MTGAAAHNRFAQSVLAEHGGPLSASGVDILQVNLGYLCNMACKHCHVDGGQRRTEQMGDETARHVLRVLEDNDIPTLDLTGGAPELNPSFRRLVERGRALGRSVLVRTNLTVFFEEGQEDLPEFLADSAVDVVASLPYYICDGADRVRGEGSFEKSIRALLRLNSLGFGIDSSCRRLNLVFNPRGAFLPPEQDVLQEEYRRELGKNFGITFNSLFTFSNMPIGRFREFLVRSGNLEKYMARLACAFNPSTLEGIMCRRLISVAYDGTLYDCDFNQALGIGLADGLPRNIRHFDLQALAARRISVDEHCFGCTAGQGST